MVGMARSNTPADPALLNSLDQRVRKVDEDRWLSSRYAAQNQRNSLITLYALNYELARIRLAVSDPTLGAIRFQWWRDALDAIPRDETPEHDVALALQTQVQDEVLSGDGLHKLIDLHERAFEANDRSLEPEALLAAMAARVFTAVHGWGEEISALAPHWAALRRNEDVGYGPVVAKVPAAIRPAVAHFRLRRVYAGTAVPSGFSKRMCVFRAMMAGRV